MLIYEQEKIDGLTDRFENLSIAVEIARFNKAAEVKLGKVTSIKNIVSELHEDDFTYEFPSILVTAGTWNNNDTVFDAQEVWLARNTIIDKPVNIGHNPESIIGHTKKTFVITDEAEARVIPEEVDGKPNSNIPDFFHILNIDNFYKYNGPAFAKKNPDFSKKVSKIYDDVVTGNTGVSMECLFSGFDYAAIDKETGKQVIIPRTEKTAKLSKHLKFFNGSGEYQGYKIGMIMRGLRFVGKGITNKPANPSSVIFSKDSVMFNKAEVQDFDKVFSPNSEIVKNSVYKEIVTGEQTMNLDEALKRIGELEKALASKESNIKLDEANRTIEGLKTELAEIKTEVEKSTSTVKTLEDSNKELQTENATLKNDMKTKVADFEKVNVELATIKADKQKVERITAIVDKLGVTKEDADKHLDVAGSLNDEQFAKYLDNAATLVSKVKEEGKKNLEEEVKKAIAEINKATAGETIETATTKDGTPNVPNTTVDAQGALKEGLSKLFSRKSK